MFPEGDDSSAKDQPARPPGSSQHEGTGRDTSSGFQLPQAARERIFREGHVSGEEGD